MTFAQTQPPQGQHKHTFLTFLLLRKSSTEECLESPRRPALICWARQLDQHFLQTGLPETPVKHKTDKKIVLLTICTMLGRPKHDTKH